jgi:hypothetical protein
LAFGQLDLLLLNLGVVLLVQLSQFGLQLGTRGGVLFDADLVFQRDDGRVHALNLGAQRFQLGHGGFAVVQCAGQVILDLNALFFQYG